MLCVWNSSMLMNTTVISSGSLQYRIPLFGLITIYFSLIFLMDIWTVSYLLLCLLIHVCKSFLLRFIPWIGFFGHRIFSYSGLLCSSNLFSKVILSSYVSLQWYIKIHRVFYLPEDCQEDCQAFKFYQFGRCEMISPWDFTLHFFAY